jgi:predicted AAA+ superfamily ATPase
LHQKRLCHENSIFDIEFSWRTQKVIPRGQLQGAMTQLVNQFPVVALLGARQVRKTTLARLATQKYKDENQAVHFFDLEDPTDLTRLANPKLGASWEGFALEEIIKTCKPREEDTFFWGVHQQGELDLLIFKNGKRIGFEFKYTDSPKFTSSMKLAKDVLKLDELLVVHPGNAAFPLENGVRTLGLLDAIIEMQPK